MKSDNYHKCMLFSLLKQRYKKRIIQARPASAHARS